MYVCMHACMYVCMHACMHVCMHACMHACMYVCMHACMHACQGTSEIFLIFLPLIRYMAVGAGGAIAPLIFCQPKKLRV